jgi:hypothetical protein
MIFQSWSLEELNVWSKLGYLDDRVRDLLRPHEMLWPRDERELTRAFAALQRALPWQRRHLLPQALVAAALSQPRLTPPWALHWLQSEVDLLALGLSLSWETACSMDWMLFPIALSEEKRGVLYWVLAGHGQRMTMQGSLPSWWLEAADESAVKSAHTALKLLRLQGSDEFCFLPVAPFTDRVLFHGPSLGLPFYLAGYSLCRGFAPQGILATGQIGEDGSLSAVGGLQAKAAAALKEGLSALLCPPYSSPLETDCGLLEQIQVGTLQEACFLWEYYESGKGNKLQADFQSLVDPRRLAANVHLISNTALLSRVFAEEYSGNIQAVLENWDLTRQFLDNLERAAEDAEHHTEHIGVMLAPFSPESVGALAAQNPLAAFRIAQIQLLSSSRQGRVELSELWAQIGGDLMGKINADEPGMDLEASHINRRIVLERHGRYDFRPELPQEAMDMVERLEELNGVLRRYGSGAVAIALGKLYGTIAQNFGFCGPAYLRETEKYVALAQEAFGSGLFKDSRKDWQRQFGYLVYAFLDAGRLVEARKAIENYLEAPPESCGEEVFNAINPYQHTALARYLGQTGKANPHYPAWCRRHLHDRPLQHPWGLWLTNVGRLFDDQADKTLAWSRAVETGLRQGITGRIMGLLPLAHLWSHGFGDRSRMEQRTGLTVADLTSSSLSQEHFRCLSHCSSWEAVLKQVLDLQARLFPFTYR